MSLRRRLAEFGFESNVDYDYALRCLFDADLAHLRVLHVDGRGGRRKTAFASALGHALEYPHILYHDFSRPEPPAAPLSALADEGGSAAADAALTPLDRVVSEACAYSEGARTLLILDQLQCAEFVDQRQLVAFASSGQWESRGGTLLAHRRHLLLVLITETTLYHSLARLAYRVWTDSERTALDLRCEDFGLPADAAELLTTLAALFSSLGAAPTLSETRRLLDDVLLRVRSEEQLRQSIFGWTEDIERDRLYSPELTADLVAVVDAIGRYHGLDHIEM